MMRAMTFKEKSCPEGLVMPAQKQRQKWRCWSELLTKSQLHHLLAGWACAFLIAVAAVFAWLAN